MRAGYMPPPAASCVCHPYRVPLPCRKDTGLVGKGSRKVYNIVIYIHVRLYNMF
jgi:hypothetical protein